MKGPAPGGVEVLRLQLVAGVVLMLAAASIPASGASTWELLIRQAEGMGLPSRFLKEVPDTFVGFEFEDLRQFAAEYHPDSHRMVLNRVLSLNAAGGTLKPVARLTATELGTLYHELFHAYMDYLEAQSRAGEANTPGQRLLDSAKQIQRCRYGQVEITPVVSNKSIREPRYLSEQESWEALNETWGVFVGWNVWNSVEHQRGRHPRKVDKAVKPWLAQLKKADAEGRLVGYYEPQDPAERAKVPKRYLAPSFRISPQEVVLLMEWIFERPGGDADQVMRAMQPSELRDRGGTCKP